MGVATPITIERQITAQSAQVENAARMVLNVPVLFQLRHVADYFQPEGHLRSWYFAQTVKIFFTAFPFHPLRPSHVPYSPSHSANRRSLLLNLPPNFLCGNQILLFIYFFDIGNNADFLAPLVLAFVQLG